MRKPLLKSKAKSKHPAEKTLPKVSAVTRLQDLANGEARVIHSQTIRQAIGYQSAEATYGLEVNVDARNARKATAVVEEIVQKKLRDKFKEHQEFLYRLAEANNGNRR